MKITRQNLREAAQSRLEAEVESTEEAGNWSTGKLCGYQWGMKHVNDENGRSVALYQPGVRGGIQRGLNALTYGVIKCEKACENWVLKGALGANGSSTIAWARRAVVTIPAAVARLAIGGLRIAGQIFGSGVDLFIWGVKVVSRIAFAVFDIIKNTTVEAFEYKRDLEVGAESTRSRSATIAEVSDSGVIAEEGNKKQPKNVVAEAASQCVNALDEGIDITELPGAIYNGIKATTGVVSSGLRTFYEVAKDVGIRPDYRGEEESAAVDNSDERPAVVEASKSASSSSSSSSSGPGNSELRYTGGGSRHFGRTGTRSHGRGGSLTGSSSKALSEEQRRAKEALERRKQAQVAEIAKEVDARQSQSSWWDYNPLNWINAMG